MIKIKSGGNTVVEHMSHTYEILNSVLGTKKNIYTKIMFVTLFNHYSIFMLLSDEEMYVSHQFLKMWLD